MSNYLEAYDNVVIGTKNVLDLEEFKQAKNPTQEVSKQNVDITK
jgi:hypothetical protein